MICLLLLFLSLSSYEVVNCINEDHLSQIPAEYSDCICHWTHWMNSDNPFDEDESDDESYRRLKSHGYEFCENPVALQCYDIGAGRLIDPLNSGTITCDVDLGLQCNFFCDDYKIKVGCCYCPPSSIGPTFQILSENNNRCLSMKNNNGSSPTTILTLCDESSVQQQWSWVSQSQIKNSMNQQCLKPINQVVTTVDCDAADSQQWWSYDKSHKTLFSGFGYLSSRSGGYDSRASHSQWMAKVEIGKTDLITMKGFPCEDEPSAPQNGSVNCNFGSYQGSVCQFSCNRGFELPSGSQNSITCLRNQLYSGRTPACQRRTCQTNLPSLSNGRVTCSDETYVDSECQFVCDEGYRLVGSTVIACDELGKWDYTLPTCELSSAQRQGRCPNRDLSRVSTGRRCRKRCETNADCRGINKVCLCDDECGLSCVNPGAACLALRKISHGVVRSTGNTFGDIAIYQCNAKFLLIGSDRRTCQSDKKWSGKEPRCEGLLATPDSGWFNGLNGFQYKVTPDAQSWNDSRRVCQSMGGDLATEGFRDKTRKAIFVSQFLSANLTTASAWIGLSDLEEEGNFKWIDGVDSTSENTFWFTSNNEPNGGSRENCVEMYSSLGQHKYNDNNCALSFKAFCAKRLDL